MFICTYSSNIYMYNLSEVKFQFLGNKKGPTKGFLPWILENWIFFLYAVYRTIKNVFIFHE